MVYHVLVYSCDSEYAVHELFIHAFINDKSKVQSIVELARKLADKYRKIEHRFEGVDMRYYGIEYLPISVGEGWFLFAGVSTRHYTEVEVLEKSGDVDLKAVEEFKSRRVTVDNDEDTAGWSYTDFILTTRKRLRENALIASYAFYETRRGFHVRATLTKPITFDEKLKLRDDLLDDYKRIEYDKLLHEHGFTGLTDLLFNEKCWVNDDGRWECYAEKPLLISRMHVRGMYYYFVYNEWKEEPKNISEYTFLERVELDTELFTLRRGVVELKKPVAPDGAYSIAKLIMENPRRYIDMFVSTDPAKAVHVAYCYVDMEACNYLTSMLQSDNAKIATDESTVLVYLTGPESIKSGILIGREGSRVKRVEGILGRRVKIIAEKIPPRVQQKKQLREEKLRFQRLLSKLSTNDVGGGNSGEEEG